MSELSGFCNLSEEDLETRRRQLRDGLVRHVRGREELSDGLALFFDVTQTMRDQLEAARESIESSAGMSRANRPSPWRRRLSPSADRAGWVPSLRSAVWP